MMKATTFKFLQRVHGWCEWAKGKVSPLLELSVMNRKVSTLYPTYRVAGLFIISAIWVATRVTSVPFICGMGVFCL